MSETEFREYVQEMRDVVTGAMETARTQGETFQHGALAHKIVAELRDRDSELLSGWMDLQAVEILRQYIGTIDRSSRAKERHKASRKAFGDAVERHKAGDPDAMTRFLNVTFVVDEASNRMQLGNMKKQDLRYAADSYQRQADANAFEASFLNALADKVGDKKVKEIFTEEQILKMRNSLTQLFAAA